MSAYLSQMHRCGRCVPQQQACAARRAAVCGTLPAAAAARRQPICDTALKACNFFLQAFVRSGAVYVSTALASGLDAPVLHHAHLNTLPPPQAEGE